MILKKHVMNADVIFSDKVISLNDKVNKLKKLKILRNFKINSKVNEPMQRKMQYFLHCLPRGSEVSDEVFLGKQSKVWQQALK